MGMGEIIRHDPAKPRRLRDTVYTERGLRLGDTVQSESWGWFTLALAVLPPTAFLVVFFW